MKVVGLSLSNCIADILAGNVKEADVEGIVARTAIKNAEDLDSVIQQYRFRYWQTDPDLGEQIAWRLFEANKVYQPRLHDEEPITTRYGIWILSRDNGLPFASKNYL